MPGPSNCPFCPIKPSETILAQTADLVCIPDKYKDASGEWRERQGVYLVLPRSHATVLDEMPARWGEQLALILIMLGRLGIRADNLEFNLTPKGGGLILHRHGKIVDRRVFEQWLHSEYPGSEASQLGFVGTQIELAKAQSQPAHNNGDDCEHDG